MSYPNKDATIPCCLNTLQRLFMSFRLFVAVLNCPLQLHQHPLYQGCVNYVIAPVRLCPLILMHQNTDLCLLLLPLCRPFFPFFPRLLVFASALHINGVLFVVTFKTLALNIKYKRQKFFKQTCWRSASWNCQQLSHARIFFTGLPQGPMMEFLSSRFIPSLSLLPPSGRKTGYYKLQARHA